VSDDPKTKAEGKLSLKGLGYGFLNDVSDTSMGGAVDPQRSTGLDYLRATVSTEYQRSALATVSTFKGIVLSSTEKLVGASRSTEDVLAGYAKQNVAEKAGDWISGFFGDKKVFAYKVYIPEIECRPAPRSFNDPIISTYYDVYVDKGVLEVDAKNAIEIGSVVTVRFDNINNFSTARIVGVSDQQFEFEGFEGASLENSHRSGGSGGGGGGGGAGGNKFNKAYNQKARSKCKQEPHPEEVRIAEYFGLEVAVLQAVGTVESGGRNDSIRFEPHLFIRDHRPDLKDQIPFTKDPGGQPYSREKSETNEAAFQHAYALDKTAAVKSVSWGRFQVLGGKLIKIAGSAEKGLSQYGADPEATSFKLLEMWLKTDNGPKAVAAAKEKDFVTFARYYNGKTQKYHYGGAIAREYNAITCGEYVPPVFGTDPALAGGCEGEGAVIYLADSQHSPGYSLGGQLRAELESQGVPLVINMAESGRGLVAGGVKGFLRPKLKKELISKLSSAKPKYAIVGLGGNDAGMGIATAAKFKKKAEEFIQILKDGGVEEIIWFGITKPMVPDTPHLKKNNGYGSVGIAPGPAAQKTRDKMRDVQKEVLPTLPGVTYIDTMQYTQNLHTSDGVHYAAAEYKTIFNAAMAGDLKTPLATMIEKIKDGCAEYEKKAAAAAAASPTTTGGKCYDDAQDIPNKSQHASILADIHPDFLPHVKSFICEAWKQKQITIRLNSSYRSVEKQQRLYNKWVNGGKRGVSPANPATGLSYHNLGMAIDFNPTLSNGTTLMSTSSKSSWRNSGIVEIGEKAGMYWGGNFSTNFDPIHFDFRTKIPRAKRPAVLTAANSQGVAPNKVNLDGIIA
jgi:lysophospholipase L1-like esterase